MCGVSSALFVGGGGVVNLGKSSTAVTKLKVIFDYLIALFLLFQESAGEES
jgi:hypothetical protein